MSTIYYYKCQDAGPDFHKFTCSEQSKQTIAEIAAENAFYTHDLIGIWEDGGMVEISIYDELQNHMFDAEIYCTIPEPEFQASIK